MFYTLSSGTIIDLTSIVAIERILMYESGDKFEHAFGIVFSSKHTNINRIEHRKVCFDYRDGRDIPQGDREKTGWKKVTNCDILYHNGRTILFPYYRVNREKVDAFVEERQHLVDAWMACKRGEQHAEGYPIEEQV